MVVPFELSELADDPVSHQLAADTLNFLLAGAKRSRRGMHRVAAQHQIVRMPNRRPEDKSRIALGINLKSGIRFVKNHEFALGQSFTGVHGALREREPGDAVRRWRPIGPAFAGL